MSKFQLILTAIFGFFIVVAVLTFALYKGGGSSAEARVTIWGDLPAEALYRVIQERIPQIDKGLIITYVEMPSATIDVEFTEALARGQGPDLLILSQERFWKNRSKLLAIPYQSISERNFKETFAEGGELFLTSEGIYALPLVVDPMVLYYNRNLLSAAGEAQPMRFWDEIFALTPKLSRRDAAGNLVQSTIALGEVRNIPNFKEILSLLFLQAGTPVTGFVGQELRSLLSDRMGMTTVPGESALDFYTQFANPTRAYYSWNRVLPDAQTHFVSGDSAYYLGFASELTTLRNKNPNLNFAVAPVPQSRVAGRTFTYGRTYGIALTRGTRNSSAALRAAMVLVSRDVAGPISENLRLAPARRDLLGARPADAATSVFYEAALQARGWRDPENDATRGIFQEMIESITSGRARTAEALNNASRRIDTLMR
jgi:multiple sugar transport system substrate-binding protein